MQIARGGKTENISVNNKKILSISVHEEEGNLLLWINEDSLSYLSIEEALELRNEINEALKQKLKLNL